MHFVVGCRIIETIMYRNHTIRFDPDGGELSLIYNPAAAWKEYLSSTGV